MICCYYCFSNKGYRYESIVWNGCYDVLMMDFGLENIVILDVKGTDYKYILWNMNRIDVINRLNNSKFDDKDSLYAIAYHVLMINAMFLMMVIGITVVYIRRVQA